MITISKSENTKTAAAKIAAVLKNPGTVALVPTETVYGLVCRASDRVAIDRIVHLKHRSAGKFLGWFVRDCTVAEQYGLRFSDTAKRLAAAYFPGAVTLIVAASENTTQAIRIPDHPLISSLLDFFDEPLVQTSANASGMPDALSLEQALMQLDGEPDIVCDGGHLEHDAAGSTVVNTVVTPPVILRQGKVFVEV